MDLAEFLGPRMARPFAWGVQDCCTFAADWIVDQRGTDPMADLRGLTSPLVAMRTVRALGGMLLAGETRLGKPLPSHRLAQVGDVVLVRSGRRRGAVSGFAFGICNGSSVAAPGRAGVAFVPISSGIAAWRI